MAIRKIVARSIGVDVITAEDLADNSITAAEITNGAVTADKLASNSVTTAKITDANVTSGKLATDLVVTHALGSASTPSITFTGDTNTGIFSPAADTIAFAEGGVESMRIDSAGRVMIGNTSAGSFDAFGNQLVVGNGSASQGVTVYSGTTSTGNIVFADGTSGTALYQGIIQYAHSVDAMDFYANYAGNSSPRMRIDGNGRILIGKTSATNSTNGVELFYNSFFTNTDSYSALFNRKGSNGEAVFFQKDENNVGNISVTASATAYNTSSDYRLKENIAPMTGALDKVSALKPCTYTWKSTGEASQGFIAHELAEVVPDAVTGEKDAVDENGNPVYQGVDTSFLVATLAAAIQEQQVIIDALKARLDAAGL